MLTYQNIMVYLILTVNGINAFRKDHEVLRLKVKTGIFLNRPVILCCTGRASNESWYLTKGDDLLIDTGSVYSEYIHDEIYTNYTMQTMCVEFRKFSPKYLDVYKCIRDKGAFSNSLVLNEIVLLEPHHPKVNCTSIFSARGVLFINLKCTIEYPGITCEDTIFWENEKTGEIKNTKERLYEISCKDDVNDSVVKTSLTIYKVTDEVFKANFFVVYVNRNQTIVRHLVITPNQDMPKNMQKNSSNFDWPIVMGASGGGVFVTIVVTVLLISNRVKIRDFLVIRGQAIHQDAGNIQVKPEFVELMSLESETSDDLSGRSQRSKQPAKMNPLKNILVPPTYYEALQMNGGRELQQSLPTNRRLQQMHCQLRSEADNYLQFGSKDSTSGDYIKLYSASKSRSYGSERLFTPVAKNDSVDRSLMITIETSAKEKKKLPAENG